MRSRCMSLLPRTTLHSDSEQLFCLIFHFFDNFIYSLSFILTTGSQFKNIHLSWQFPLPWKWWWMARAGYPWVGTHGDTSHTMPRHRLLILSFLLRIAGRIRWFLCLCMMPHGTWSSSKSKFPLVLIKVSFIPPAHDPDLRVRAVNPIIQSILYILYLLYFDDMICAFNRYLEPSISLWPGRGEGVHVHIW